MDVADGGGGLAQSRYAQWKVPALLEELKGRDLPLPAKNRRNVLVLTEMLMADDAENIGNMDHLELSDLPATPPPAAPRSRDGRGSGSSGGSPSVLAVERRLLLRQKRNRQHVNLDDDDEDDDEGDDADVLDDGALRDPRGEMLFEMLFWLLCLFFSFSHL
jgi:hypothetical protein